jgi:ribosomal-protein-alanine N-acetyltransferase
MNPPPVELRHAVASDLDAILALERGTDNAPHWPPSAYAAILDSTSQQRCLIVAQVDGALTGFAIGLLRRGDHVAELESVVVAANARRAGIGRALCCAVLDWCRSEGATEVVLEVRAASAGAIALYASLGFTQTGRRPRYYHDPEDDALAMRLQLADPA